jgi:hypothetical protein
MTAAPTSGLEASLTDPDEPPLLGRMKAKLAALLDRG